MLFSAFLAMKLLQSVLGLPILLPLSHRSTSVLSGSLPCCIVLIFWNLSSIPIDLRKPINLSNISQSPIGWKEWCQSLEEVQGASHFLAFVAVWPLFLPAHKPPLHQHLLSPCNVFPQSIAPDLWSVLWKTLLCISSTISSHQMTKCSVSLVLQPQLWSRLVALKCFLGIYTF